MKKGLGLMLSFLMLAMSMLVIPPGGALAANTTYYVDSAAGNDSNNGTSTGAPWKSLSKVNSKTFQPGDKILFKAGGMWTGTLHPLGSGSSSGQITIDMYGSGSKPVMAGNGAAAGVLLQGQEYWTINNLKVTNHASGNGKRSGIRVEAKASGITHNIFISSCEVTDVTGDIRRANDMYYCSGIHVTYVGTASSSNHFDNVLIQNNNIHDVTTSGIKVDQSDSGTTPTHTNVTIKNNTISRTGSDGIIIATTINGLVDHNALFDAGYYGNTTDTFAIAGMWTCAARNTTFQYNEVARTRLFTTDGTGFDTDFGTGGILTFQYNYSHGNQGGFWLDCAELNKASDYNKSVLRYNISVNDLLYVTRHAANDAELYNNVFYKSSGKLDPDMAATQTGHRYWNNIFDFQSTPNWGAATYDYNCYYPMAKAPSDAHGVTGNPAFVSAGAMGDGIGYASCYKIGANSSCINKGMTITSNGGKDFWGNTLYNGSPDIGAYEYGAASATPSPTPTPAGTPTPASTGGIKLQFFNGTTAAVVNTLSPNFKVINTGTTPISLSDVKLRYYFTNDGTQDLSFAFDYSTIGTGNITGSFSTIAKANADRCLEVGFTGGAGTLAAGTDTEVKGRVWKSDWSSFTQTNDYSFNSAAANYVDATTVTGYISGALKWGTEP